MKQSEKLLHGGAVALVNFKGGSMKSTLSASIATISSETEGWNTVVVDLDSSAPLTKSIFFKREIAEHNTILEALRRVSHREQIDDLLLHAPALGGRAYVLPGYGRGRIPKIELPPKSSDGAGIPARYEDYIPELISEISQCFVDGEPVDLIVVDCPGENEVVNENVLMGADFVAMPASFTATDITASRRTIGLINYVQRKRKGAPIFLGFIPTFVSRGGAIDRAVITAGVRNLVVQMILSGMLLPFIPASEYFRKTFAQTSSSGIVTVPGFAKNTGIGKRVTALWEAMNSRQPKRDRYLTDLLEYLSLSIEDFNGSTEKISG